MERMIVTTFGTDAEAQRGVSALKDLNASGDITLYGVVVLGKDVSGKVTVRLGSGEIVEGTSTGLLTSAMLGLIAGPARMGTDTSLDALSGMLFELSQAGVDVRFAARVSDELRPGTVVVVASADEDWTVPVDTRMAALGGVVFRQPQMVEILHADNQRCRRLSPGDGGDDLLQLGQTGARAAAGWRHGET